MYNNEELFLEKGNWEEHIKKVPDKSVDLVFTDLPYASKTFGKCVDCKWDTPINLDILWSELHRVRKSLSTPMFFCCNMKFAVDLIDSNKKEFRYDLIWVKSAPCGFLCAKKMPMRKHEIVLVFYGKLPFYDLSSHTHKFMNKNKNKNDSSVLDKTEQKGIYGTLPTSDKLADTQGIKRADKHKAQYDPALPTSILDDICTPEQMEQLKENAISANIKSVITIDDEGLKNEPINRDNQPLDVELEFIIPDNTSVIKNIKTDCYSFSERVKSGKLSVSRIRWDPPLPVSVIEEDNLKNKEYNPDGSTIYGENGNWGKKHYTAKERASSVYDPPLPTSMIETTINNTIYTKYNKVNYSKRKNGESAYDPPLPTSMIENVKDGAVNENFNCLYGDIKTPEYVSNNIERNILRRKYKKEGKSESAYDPPLPTSMIENKEETSMIKDGQIYNNGKSMPLAHSKKVLMENLKNSGDNTRYEPPLPTSMIENSKEYIFQKGQEKKKEWDGFSNKTTYQDPQLIMGADWKKTTGGVKVYEPPLPTSMIENKYDNTIYGDINMVDFKGRNGKSRYEPPLPTTMLDDELTPSGHCYKPHLSTDKYHAKSGLKSKGYEPPIPNSILNDDIDMNQFTDYVLDPPDSLLRIKSKKGKHATQKPTDLMKWVLKYYSKPGDVVLDPTMGSGSTGVAAQDMGRKFIGFEMDDDIFEVAKQRILIDKA
tara:strand:- start:3225 stop:5357 length:2133 start_codon:yes stop_codon:yes gene_type:complete